MDALPAPWLARKGRFPLVANNPRGDAQGRLTLAGARASLIACRRRRRLGKAHPPNTVGCLGTRSRSSAIRHHLAGHGPGGPVIVTARQAGLRQSAGEGVELGRGLRWSPVRDRFASAEDRLRRSARRASCGSCSGGKAAAESQSERGARAAGLRPPSAGGAPCCRPAAVFRPWLPARAGAGHKFPDAGQGLRSRGPITPDGMEAGTVCERD